MRIAFLALAAIGSIDAARDAFAADLRTRALHLRRRAILECLVGRMDPRPDVERARALERLADRVSL